MPKDFDSYWRSMVEKNPSLAGDDGRMTLPVSSFKRQVERAYQQGQSDLVDMNAAVQKLREKLGSAMADGFFDGMSGGKS